MEESYWKISDFSKKLGKHNNTVDGWFRTLEERRLHYISRVNGEKIYDELDFKIAKFIIEKRADKWSLDGVFDNLVPSGFTLRPFPTNFEGESKSVQVVDVDKIRATIVSELKTTFEEVVSAQVTKQMEDFKRLLPSPDQGRLDRFNSLVAERKVIRVLEEEALSMWSTKPAEERLKKSGWFRKEEDIDKRDRFVRDYIDKLFEERLKEEFDVK